MSDLSNMRKPVVAGQFYENDPKRLNAHISRMRKKAGKPPAPPEGNILRAVILPHAGYPFSGETAVKTLSRATGGNYRKVLILAPSHRVPFKGLAVSVYDKYRTPLGDIPVNTEASEYLISSGFPFITEINEAHAYEHSLEVELPISQAILKRFELIPLMCGTVDKETAVEAAKALTKFWNRDTLWIISSDFTHYGNSFGYTPFKNDIKENLWKLDSGAIEKITKLDPEGFNEYISSTGATVCGANPILILLEILKQLGQKEHISAELVDYVTSGDLTGDWEHCVSYAGIAFYGRD